MNLLTQETAKNQTVQIEIQLCYRYLVCEIKEQALTKFSERMRERVSFHDEIPLDDNNIIVHDPEQSFCAILVTKPNTATHLIQWMQKKYPHLPVVYHNTGKHHSLASSATRSQVRAIFIKLGVL